MVRKKPKNLIRNIILSVNRNCEETEKVQKLLGVCAGLKKKFDWNCVEIKDLSDFCLDYFVSPPFFPDWMNCHSFLSFNPFLFMMFDEQITIFLFICRPQKKYLPNFIFEFLHNSSAIIFNKKQKKKHKQSV